MKYLSLLAFALLLNTSCGIFKKTSSTFKEKKGYKIESNLEVNNETNTVEFGNTIDKSKLEVKAKNRTTIYPSKNSTVSISEDGTVTGNIDSIVQDITKTTNEVKDIINNIAKKRSTKKDSISNQSEEAKQEVVVKEKTKTPDKGSITIIGIITGLVIVIVVIILLRRR